MGRVPDPNKPQYYDEIREHLENDLLEKIANNTFEEHFKRFSAEEGMGLLYGLASRSYIDLKFIPDGDSPKVATFVTITDAGRKYVEIIRQHKPKHPY